MHFDSATLGYIALAGAPNKEIDKIVEDCETSMLKSRYGSKVFFTAKSFVGVTMPHIHEAIHNPQTRVDLAAMFACDIETI